MTELMVSAMVTVSLALIAGIPAILVALTKLRTATVQAKEAVVKAAGAVETKVASVETKQDDLKSQTAEIRTLADGSLTKVIAENGLLLDQLSTANARIEGLERLYAETKKG